MLVFIYFPHRRESVLYKEIEMFKLVPFLHASRMAAWRDRVRKDDLSLLLLNDGRHIYVSDQICLGGRIPWRWVRFLEFSESNNLHRHINKKNVILKHLGHANLGYGTASVIVRQYLEKEYGRNSNKVEIRKDWQVSLLLFPHVPVIIQTHGDRSVVVSKVLSFK